MSERLICVTGGSGYLGGAVVTYLHGLGYRLRVFERMLFGNVIAGLRNVEFIQGDITDVNAVADAMKGVTDVIHLAGIVTDTLVDYNPAYAFKVNVGGTENVAKAASEAGAARFIYMSSSSVYGYAAEREIDVTEDVIPLPKTTYANQKLEGETAIKAWFGSTGTYAILRPATISGPAARMRLDSIINNCSRQAFFNQRITIHGGKQYRSNVHVQDAVEVIQILLTAPPERLGRIFNLTWGNMPVGDIGELAANLYRTRYKNACEVIYQDILDTRSYRLTAKALKDVFGWSPKRSMADAISDNFDWFEAGNVRDPEDPIYFNDRRMADYVRRGQ